MASITYWSQLLPGPGAAAPSVAESLAARVRDPAWLLARQWQLGEFQGADAGTPAFARIASHTAALASATVGGTTLPLGAAELLTPLVAGEPVEPDLATRVEIGQTFEELLEGAGIATAVRDQFRVAYPIAPAGPGADPDAASFLQVCAGRAVDGAALVAAARAAAGQTPPLPPRPVLDPSLQAAVAAVLAALVAWVDATWGPIGAGAPPAWDPLRLEYGIDLTAGTTDGASFTLKGRPDAHAELDWYAYDLTRSTAASPAPAAPAPAAPATKTSSVLPGHVRFRGMPNARWWDFEGDKTDFGAVLPDARDLAKLLFMDFMLLHGDDWYLAPLDVAAGSLAFIDTLTVTDVFGVTAAIARADAAPGSPWTMFSTTIAGGGFAPFLVVPAASASLVGAPVEEVHLLRDETADMAWAIEHTVAGPTGTPRSEPPVPELSRPPGAPPTLLYQLATPLSPSWFPLLPVKTAAGSLALTAGTVDGGPLAPTTRFVQELSTAGLQLPSEEVPRAGVQLQRRFERARSADGRLHLWLARRKRIGAGQAASGLRYDVILDQ